MTSSREMGQQSVWTATFKDDNNAPVDPATVVFKWMTSASSSSSTTYTYGTDDEITRKDVGVYEFTSPVYTNSGAHFLRAESTAPASAHETSIQVQQSWF